MHGGGSVTARLLAVEAATGHVEAEGLQGGHGVCDSLALSRLDMSKGMK